MQFITEFLLIDIIKYIDGTFCTCSINICDMRRRGTSELKKQISRIRDSASAIHAVILQSRIYFATIKNAIPRRKGQEMLNIVVRRFLFQVNNVNFIYMVIRFIAFTIKRMYEYRHLLVR